MDSICPNCHASGMDVFFEARDIPVHSCMMLEDRQAAVDYPTRDLALGFCRACGFISNVLFDPNVQEYAEGYEEQQSFSPRFCAFQTSLIARLIDRYDLRDKDVVEIGCGKGDFLIELCEAGGNRGVGIDPACDPLRFADRGAGRVRFIAELYSAAHADLACDFLCCRHTLEHIHPTSEFIGRFRQVLGDNEGVVVLLEVPDVGRVLRERAFWDIYYEHCSYFGLGSLARLFRANHFDVVDLTKDFDDQYLLLVARPVDAPTSACLDEEDDLEQITGEVEAFSSGVRDRIAGLHAQVAGLRDAGKRVAIWGSGSKCVSFLSTVGVGDEIDAVVDINPHRQGKFLAGSGKQVVAPAFLQANRIDAILVMNAVYCAEIQRQIDEMGVSAELIPV